MCNCNFEAMNYVLNKRMKKKKKIEMKYRQFICIIVSYLMLYRRFRKDFLMLVCVKNFLHLLVTFLVIAVCRYNYNLNFKPGNFF